MIRLALALVLLLVVSSGCLSITGPDAATNVRNEKLNATASFALQKTIDVALQTVLNAAVSQSDAAVKGNYLDGLASGLRSQEGNLLTAGDVQSLVSIWTPKAPHWVELGAQLSQVYAQGNPRTPVEASVILENMAKGLNTTASAAPSAPAK